MPGIRSLYGSDIEQASTLLAKMNLWLASARKGQSFPSLDSNIVTRDVFEACNAVAAERENRKTFLKEIWGIEVPPRLTVYLSNPPWGEDSDELDVRASGARAEVPEETKNAVADLSAEMTIEIGRKKITLEMGKTGNHYIPFLLIPFWDSFATKESNGLIAYSVILPDQLFIGYQRRSFRSYIWPTIRRYYGFMQNVEGTFEASTLDSAPAKTMRFGVLAGECKWENRNRIKVCFAKAEKPAPLPKRAAEIGLLPLFESNDDIEIWNELFESSAERLDLEWKKGELNRKLLKDLSNLKPFQGKNAVHIRASRKWNTKLSHKFDPTGVAEILHPTSEESRRKKIKLMRSKRLFFPSQTTFSDKNSNQFRVETDANVIATDHWLYLASENPDTLSKAESVLRSDLWFRLSRLISTRTSISVQYLNELGIPDIETQPKVEREAS
jgi:hypothetical protein